MEVTNPLTSEDSCNDTIIIKETEDSHNMNPTTSKSVVKFLSSQMTSLRNQINGLKQHVETTMDDCHVLDKQQLLQCHD
jgi:hypothetical protein